MCQALLVVGGQVVQPDQEQVNQVVQLLHRQGVAQERPQARLPPGEVGDGPDLGPCARSLQLLAQVLVSLGAGQGREHGDRLLGREGLKPHGVEVTEQRPVLEDPVVVEPPGRANDQQTGLGLQQVAEPLLSQLPDTLQNLVRVLHEHQHRPRLEHGTQAGHRLLLAQRPQVLVVNEILALEKAGVQVDIFALGPVSETHFQEAISRVRAPVHRIRHQFHDTELYWQLLVQARKALPEFRRLAHLADDHDWVTVGQAVLLAMQAQSKGIRHLHAHFGTQAATVARLAAAFAGIHYSVTAHAKDIYHQYEEPVQLDLKIRDAAFTVTVSDYNVDYLRTHFGAPTDRTHRIYNGLDLSAFPYHPPINRPSHVVAVGRLVGKKGFPFLIEAIGLLRDRGIDCRCTLVGDGPLRPQLQKQIEDLGLTDRVQLAGVRPLTEVSAFLKGAAVLVAPSIISEGGDRDGLPTILVEGMALGTPCISTQVVGIPELIRDHETGLCVPPNDAKALADAIAEMLGNPTMARLLADNARALIESEYDVHRNTARLRDLFAQSIQAVDARHAAHRPSAVE